MTNHLHDANTGSTDEIHRNKRDGSRLTASLCLFFAVFLQLELSEILDLRLGLFNTRQNSEKCLIYTCIILIAFSLAYLKNDNLAVIGLQVESPGGGDQAVGLVHYVFPEPSDQRQGVQQVDPWHHGVQLRAKIIIIIHFDNAVFQ